MFPIRQNCVSPGRILTVGLMRPLSVRVDRAGSFFWPIVDPSIGVFEEHDPLPDSLQFGEWVEDAVDDQAT